MASSKKKQKDSTTGQMVGLFLVLLLLVALSTVGTLVAVGVIDFSEETHPVGSITDAESICNGRVKSDYGESLNAITVDEFSSRYDQQTGVYKMFYELNVYRGKGKTSGVNTFYVNCFVSANNGGIKRIDYLEQKDFKPKAIRRSHGNAFGF